MPTKARRQLRRAFVRLRLGARFAGVFGASPACVVPAASEARAVSAGGAAVAGGFPPPPPVFAGALSGSVAPPA